MEGKAIFAFQRILKILFIIAVEQMIKGETTVFIQNMKHVLIRQREMIKLMLQIYITTIFIQIILKCV